MNPSSSQAPSHEATFQSLKACVLIPTYNNASSLPALLEEVLTYTSQVLVVNDGSTDETEAILKRFPQLKLVSYATNIGKGYALRKGFDAARGMGYDYAITLDSDGQHYPDDIPRFLERIAFEPGSLLVGARNMDQESVPGGSSFGNRFSNFWFKVETGITLPDTQSGFRLYPLKPLAEMRFFTRKYEFEIEVMVRAAWKGVPIKAVPVKVYYPPADERVSHFRPFKDFFRISVLNTVLVLIAFLYIKPRDFFRYVKKKRFREHLHDLFLDPRESVLRKSLAVALGLFMGIVPIWGYQLVSAIGLAYLLKLNRPLVILAANISIPPIIPLILYGSYWLGGVMQGKEGAGISFDTSLDLSVIHQQFFQYVVGSMGLAVITALVGGLVTFGILQVLMRKKA